MKEITLNLSGLKPKFRYNDDFSVLEAHCSDGTWIDFGAGLLPCGTTIWREQVIEIIKEKTK